MCQLIQGRNEAVAAEVVVEPIEHSAVDEVSEAVSETVSENASGGKKTWMRLVALLALSVGLYFAGQAMGFGELSSFTALQEMVNSAGLWGRVAYLVVFALVALMQLPAAVFIVGALLLWGPTVGGALGWSGAMLALAVHFAVARGVGGSPFQNIDNPFAKKLLAKLDKHPVPVTAALRVLMLMSPPVNLGLILAGVRFRDYMLGSAIGLGLVVLTMALGFDMVEPWLRSVLG